MTARLSCVLMSAGIALCSILSCSKKSVEPERKGSVTWVGTSVVFDATLEKKNYSLILFTASWCGWCDKLENETLTDLRVCALIDSAFNAVRVDPDADSLVSHFDTLITCRDFVTDIYQIHGFPTILAYDRSGEINGRCTGYQAPSELIAWMRSILQPVAAENSGGNCQRAELTKRQ